MVGLIASVLLFNFIAFKARLRLTKNQLVHIWMFTVAFQLVVDLYVDVKYKGYWYFTKEVDWGSLLALVALVPPVNLIFLNWYPFWASRVKQVSYVFGFTVFILLYECFTLLPEPIGYFHYGWWNIWYSAVEDPLLLYILLAYHKWICKLEESS